MEEQTTMLDLSMLKSYSDTFELLPDYKEVVIYLKEYLAKHPDKTVSTEESCLNNKQ